MTPDEKLTTILLAEVADHEPSPAGWDVIRAGLARRRRRRVLVRGGGLAAATVLSAAVAIVIATRSDDTTTLHIDPAATPSATASASAPSPSPVRAATRPVTFVAVKDQRVAVFRSADGTLVRYLSEPTTGGVYDASLSPDGDTVVYVEGAGTCVADVWSVPITGGTRTRLVRTDGVAGSPVLSDDGRLAYQVNRCGADSQEADLVIRDLATGRQGGWAAEVPREIPAPRGWLGDTLLVSVLSADASAQRFVLLEVSGTSGQTGRDPVRARPGCDHRAAALHPDGVLALLAERCAGATNLVELNLSSNATTRLHTVPTQRLDDESVISVDYDASGQHILYVFTSAGDTPAEVYRLTRGGRREMVLRGAAHAYW